MNEIAWEPKFAGKPMGEKLRVIGRCTQGLKRFREE